MQFILDRGRATPLTKYDNRKYGFKIGGLNG